MLCEGWDGNTLSLLFPAILQTMATTTACKNTDNNAHGDGDGGEDADGRVGGGTRWNDAVLEC